LLLFSEMGRRPWATPEQLEYLKTFIPRLEQAKTTSGLTTLYAKVYDGFLQKWSPPPVIPKPGTSPSPEQLDAKAKLRKVSLMLNLLTSCTHHLPAHHPLVWGRAEEAEALDSPKPPTSRSCP
jgi:hypothetical protein